MKPKPGWGIGKLQNCSLVESSDNRTGNLTIHTSRHSTNYPPLPRMLYLHTEEWLIGELENSRRELALVAQRLENWFLTVGLQVQFSPGRLRWCALLKSSNRTKQLSSAPASFRLSTLLISDEILIKISIYPSSSCMLPPYRGHG